MPGVGLNIIELELVGDEVGINIDRLKVIGDDVGMLDWKLLEMKLGGWRMKLDCTLLHWKCLDDNGLDVVGNEV